jgi:hypothetical protein
MDKNTLLSVVDYVRDKLLGTLDAIEKSGADPAKVLAWRPGPGRAHIGWQAMHCAASLDRLLNVRLKGGKPADEALIANFASGSTPSDDKVPTLSEIRQALETHLANFKAFINSATPEELARKRDFPDGVQRSTYDVLTLVCWHEAHHQGQSHLTWNLYKAAHNIG